MAQLNELLEVSSQSHHHLCPRQVLGVRMGVLAAQTLSLQLPQANKRLMTWVETDGCFADGIRTATGCAPGRRTLRLMDYGKVAATFVDTLTEQAVRIFPHYESRERVRQYASDVPSRWHQYLQGYQVIPDHELFITQSVELNLSLNAIISSPEAFTICHDCGEEISMIVKPFMLV